MRSDAQRSEAAAERERRRQDVVHRAAAWAARSREAGIVSWLWTNLPDGTRGLFDDARDFAERVDERVGLMEN